MHVVANPALLHHVETRQNRQEILQKKKDERKQNDATLERTPV
jgi:hypothetical protein